MLIYSLSQDPISSSRWFTVHTELGLHEFSALSTIQNSIAYPQLPRYTHRDCLGVLKIANLTANGTQDGDTVTLLQFLGNRPALWP
jgi:hypothetical protein